MSSMDAMLQDVMRPFPALQETPAEPVRSLLPGMRDLTHEEEIQAANLAATAAHLRRQAHLVESRFWAIHEAAGYSPAKGCKDACLRIAERELGIMQAQRMKLSALNPNAPRVDTGD